MKAIVLFLALASGALADEYTPVDWLGITSKGEVHIQIGGLFMTVGGCTNIGNINDTRYDVKSSKWQYSKGEDSEWVDIPGSERTGEICAFDPSYIDIKGGGLYRFVAEISIDGEVGKYAPGSIIRVLGEPKEDESAADGSAVEAVSWGAIEAAQR